MGQNFKDLTSISPTDDHLERATQWVFGIQELANNS